MKDEARSRRAFTLVELLVTIAIIGILIGLLLPAVQTVRESARRTQCMNNVRQLGLAALCFESTHEVFPASGWTKSGPGNSAGKYVGWRPLLLPFVEQTNLQRLYDFGENWWDETNPAAAAVPVLLFQCPTTPGRTPVLSAVAHPPRPAMSFENPIAPTDYEAIMGVQPASINPHFPSPFYNSINRYSVMHRNSRNGYASIGDGSSNTLMVVECAGRPDVYRGRKLRSDLSNDQGIGWADSEGPFSFDATNSDGSLEGGGPTNGCSMVMNRRNDNEPYSFHPGGISGLFADGHVAFVTESMEVQVFAKLITRDGGEVVSADEF
jgi:prepilin-type N-terminal cleavage/methylation domain-containing protein/prepilin-type processing-associated H-X9-DG protein